MPPPKMMFTRSITFRKASGVDVGSGSDSLFCAGATIMANVW